MTTSEIHRAAESGIYIVPQAQAIKPEDKALLAKVMSELTLPAGRGRGRTMGAKHTPGPQSWQIEMGCPGCKFCDEKALSKGQPCCTYFGKLLTAGVTCLIRIPRAEQEFAQRGGK
jgi:hypothetical protein